MTNPEISQLLPILQQNGFVTQLLPANNEFPNEQLFVALGTEHKYQTWKLEMLLLPGVDAPPLLQLFLLLPLEVKETVISDLVSVIVYLNDRLPLPGFGFNWQDGIIYYRLIVPCSNRELDGEAILGTIRMICYLVDEFVEILEDVAQGNKNQEQGMQAIEQQIVG
ncbi:hypothetical protein F7734_12450 [Scytonema sp. UIC 10036]|uniref:hypothetical protein n=1 Tax=Scytonema sp. UIC 10036 TaxID=2304196 RepID=UPI0012DA65B2|nr:hypothetical protein [Scytonema sp. UIC 10036]MUG93197.1 hypothetical protein [Scytonema sp. UIC 10036]